MGKQFDETPIFPILDILSYYGGSPPSSGRQWAPLCCPLHKERSPSATVNVQAQRWMCHVCFERSEDAIGTVMFVEQCDFKRAVEICESLTNATNEPAAKKPGGMSSMFD